MLHPAKSLLILCFSTIIIDSVAQQRDSVIVNALAEKVDQYLISASNQYEFNGVALFAQKGNIVLQKGYGWRNVKDKTRNDSSSIFQIGSITKQFTATTILKLQEQGKLSVFDPLSKYFPDYPNGNKITLHHLLTHTSGIYNYTNNLQPFKFIVKKTISQKKVVNIFEHKPLAFEPGTQFNYTNSGYYLLGMIIEKITSKPYEQVIRESIFTPLGMTHSGFDFRSLSHSSKATGYSLLNKDRQVKASIMDSTVTYSAGAIYSTVMDLYKWLKAVSHTQIITADSWKQATTPYKSNYGYGWGTDSLYGKKYIAHGGEMMNFMSYIIYYPNEDITLILLNNFYARESLWRTCVELSQIVFEQTFPWGNSAEVNVDPEILNRYTGTYAYPIDDKSQLYIFVEGGKLLINGTAATGVSKLPLVALSQRRFYYKKLALEIEFRVADDSNSGTLITKLGGIYSEWKKIK